MPPVEIPVTPSLVYALYALGLDLKPKATLPQEKFPNNSLTPTPDKELKLDIKYRGTSPYVTI